MPKPRPSRDLEVFDADDWPVPKADDTASATKPKASRDDEVFGEPDSSKEKQVQERRPRANSRDMEVFGTAEDLKESFPVKEQATYPARTARDAEVFG